MTGSAALRRFLSTDPRDVACGEAMELLDVYADLAVHDPAQAQRLYPGVAAHLSACGPCAEDLTGLLAAIRDR
jgi:hypothetical protein